MKASDQPARRKAWFRRALNLLLLVALVAGIRVWQHRDMVSGLAPPLKGTLLDGSAYTLPVKPQQPVLVHFWATWCPICRAEQGSIPAIAHEHPGTITIAMQSGSSPEVARYLAAQGVSYPVVNDQDGGLASAWGVHAVPASFVIGTDGEVRFIEVGYTTELGLRARLWLAGVLR